MVSRTLPATFRQLFVTKITSNFRDAVEIKEMPLTRPGPNQVLIRNRFVGVNASDVNMTAGLYNPGHPVPFPIGFEAIGNVVAVGDGCPPLLNKPVVYIKSGAYSEYSLVNYKQVMPVPTLDRNYVTLPVSGLTAAISLERDAQIKSGETVLVTAAAGGTGQFAVQLAKNKGCHVIGTCSSDDKAEFLKSIGCDRPVIYTKEDLKTVLKTEYPKGVDVVYECVGGEIFDAALKNLAPRARVIIIGFIEKYMNKGTQPEADDKALSTFRRMPSILIATGACIKGFFLINEAPLYASYTQKLVELYQKGELKVSVDQGEGRAEGVFTGLDAIVDALEHLYSKKSVGKVIVEVCGD